MQLDDGMQLGGVAYGSRILTPSGERLVESLQQGDQVMTVDHGVQTVRWVGHVPVGHVRTCETTQGLLLSAESLEPGTPCRDITVLPEQRVLLTGPDICEHFADEGILVPARLLLPLPAVAKAARATRQTYFGVMFDAPEIILADGLPVESLNPHRFRYAQLGALEAAAKPRPQPNADIRFEPPEAEIQALVAQRCFVAEILRAYTVRPPMRDARRGWLH